jgi:hypothetical protein
LARRKVMGGKSKVDTVAGALRWAIIRGQFSDGWLPKETQMAEELKVSRPTLRSALVFLQAEHLVKSVPGVRWRAATSIDNTSFETLTRLFEDMVDHQKGDVIRALLDHRTELVIGVVAALLKERGTVDEAVKTAARLLEPSALDPEPLTNAVLAREDAFFTALVTNHGTLSSRLAAQQVQRAVGIARAWLNPLCRTAPDGPRCLALIEATEAWDLRARDLAFEVVTARGPLYETLIARRLARCQIGNTSVDPPVG